MRTLKLPLDLKVPVTPGAARGAVVGISPSTVAVWSAFRAAGVGNPTLHRGRTPQRPAATARRVGDPFAYLDGAKPAAWRPGMKVLRGLAAVYNEASVPRGGRRRRFADGVFAAADLADVKLTVNHAGRALAAVADWSLLVWPSRHGLAFVACLPAWEIEVEGAFDRGAVRGVSAGYVYEAHDRADGDETVVRVREVNEISLMVAPDTAGFPVTGRHLSLTGGRRD
jgi:phage head maturation protease